MIPFSVSFWPVPSGNNTIDVTAEFELTRPQFEFKHVRISMPLSTSGHSPKVNHVDGDYVLNSAHKSLDWIVPLINSANANGTFEFTVPGDNVDALFPVSISFVTDKSFIGLEAVSAVSGNGGDGDQVEFTKDIKLSAEDYRIV